MRIKLIFTIVVTAFSLKSYSQTNIDSLLSQLQISEGIEKVDILNQLTDYYKLDNTSKAKDLALQASILAETMNYKHGIGYSSYCLGYIEYIYGNFNDAIEYSQYASDIADELHNPDLKLQTYELLALIYEEIADNEKSVHYFLQALELNQTMKNFVGAGLSLLGMGRIFGNLGDEILSLESNQKSLDIFQRLKNDAGMAKSNIAIAKNYFNLGDYDSMSYYYSNAEKLIRKQGSKELLLELYIEKYQLYSGSYTDSSVNYIQKAISLADELGRVYLERDLLLKSSEIFSQRGEYQLAYDLHQSYIRINDSLSENKGEIGTQKLELSLKDVIYSEQEDVFREIEKYNNRERDQYKTMVYALGVIVLIISGSLVFLTMRYSSQKKSVAKMRELYNEIEGLSNEINKKEEIILNLRSKHSKKIVDYEIQGLSEMALAKSTKKTDLKMSETEFLNQANQQFISKQWASLQGARDRLRYKKEYFKLEDILVEDWEYVNLDRLSQSLIDTTNEYINENIKIHHNTDPNLNVYCHKESILLLIYLLLRNAIEAINKEGAIYLDYNSDKEKLVYRIIDTGCGISLDDKSQIFAPFYSTKKQEGHYGLGLSVCLEIIKNHKAVIKVKSKPGIATEFGLEFYYD